MDFCNPKASPDKPNLAKRAIFPKEKIFLRKNFCGGALRLPKNNGDFLRASVKSGTGRQDSRAPENHRRKTDKQGKICNPVWIG